MILQYQVEKIFQSQRVLEKVVVGGAWDGMLARILSFKP